MLKVKTLIGGITIAALLGGCSLQSAFVSKEIDPDSLRPVEASTLVPGEYFIFTGGVARITKSADRDSTLLSTAGGRELVFKEFYQPYSITSADGIIEGVEISDEQGSLWPLDTGNKVTFKTLHYQQTLDGTRKNGAERNWTCSVAGGEQILVPAGWFDTRKVICERYSSSSGSWRGTNTFFFSEKTGYYVAAEYRSSSGSLHTQQLLRYGFNSEYLTATDQQSLTAVRDAALNKNQKGTSRFWRNAEADVSVIITPLSTKTITSGKQSCRVYSSVYIVKGRISENERTMCQQEDGTWTRVQ